MIHQELVDFLKGQGVCDICQLRYLKARGNEYRDLKESFEKLNVKYETDSSETLCKKPKLEVCPCCLGLFSHSFQSLLIERILKTDIQKFECDDIVVAICMPMLVQTRQLSMWYALLEKFGTQIEKERAPDVPLKEAVKLIINPIICKELKKKYEPNGNGIMINIQLSHSLEEENLKQLKQLHEKAFPTPPNAKRQPVSRGVLEKQYTPKRLKPELFQEFFPIPPPTVDDILSLESMELTGPTVFVAGRYRKITREMSHTPWVLNGKRIMEDSIEEIIIKSVAPYFCNDTTKVIFMSSGREDVDVRCLGKGRPFVLEIPNSVHTTLPVTEAYRMECEIDKSLKLSVRNLQMVNREELVHIKSGEEQKKKYYRALCKLRDPATIDLLRKLDLPEGFEIQQKTPIRVLHRRPLHTRPRTIFKMKAWVHQNDTRLLVLDVVSQAGTYIKELVHGEFGRTTPSVSSIIEQPVDILALDVLAIDLDWPKEIDNGIGQETK
ncbi:putative tRNA pseudouridine synthase Pus10 [Stomoxys calcitrans]|uniref:putative tRNA pseudouridine synthase Pus10 n=1 Tax=Stomoxys calcitrans TaxID=35570 RepID=UPI0027E32120|nr:putative tRNA pseudouridine synthase Pus10 [Stomoxys calcitrans]